MNNLLRIFGFLLLSFMTFLVFFGAYQLKTNSYYLVPNFKLIGQEKSLFCWVASVQMIDYSINNMNIGTQDDQCQIAEFLYKNDSCKNKSLGTNFNFYENYLAEKNIESVTSSELISFEKFKKEFFFGRPVILSSIFIRTDNFNAEHAVVATGYIEKNDSKWIFINDPYCLDTLNKCNGCNYLINFDYLTNKDNLDPVNFRIVTNIQSKTNNIFAKIIRGFKEVLYDLSNLLIRLIENLLREKEGHTLSEEKLSDSFLNFKSEYGTIFPLLSVLGIDTTSNKYEIIDSIKNEYISLTELANTENNEYLDSLIDDSKTELNYLLNNEINTVSISFKRSNNKGIYILNKIALNCDWLKRRFVSTRIKVNRTIIAPAPINKKFIELIFINPKISTKIYYPITSNISYNNGIDEKTFLKNLEYELQTKPTKSTTR